MCIKTDKTETAKRYWFYWGFSGQNGKQSQNGIRPKRQNGTAKRQNKNGQNSETAIQNRNGKLQNGKTKTGKKAPPNGQNGNQNGQNGFPQNEIKTESAKLYQNGIKPKRIQNGFETESKRKKWKRKRKRQDESNPRRGCAVKKQVRVLDLIQEAKIDPQKHKKARSGTEKTAWIRSAGQDLL